MRISERTGTNWTRSQVQPLPLPTSTTAFWTSIGLFPLLRPGRDCFYQENARSRVTLHLPAERTAAYSAFATSVAIHDRCLE